MHSALVNACLQYKACYPLSHAGNGRAAIKLTSLDKSQMYVSEDESF